MASLPKSLTIKVRIATSESLGERLAGLQDGGRASLMLMYAVLGFHLLAASSSDDRDAARARSEEPGGTADLSVKMRVPAHYPLGAHLAETAVALRHKRLAMYILLGYDFASGEITLGSGASAAPASAVAPSTPRHVPVTKKAATAPQTEAMLAPNVGVLDDGLLSSLTSI